MRGVRNQPYGDSAELSEGNTSVAVAISDEPDKVKKVSYPYAIKIDFKPYHDFTSIPAYPYTDKVRRKPEKFAEIAKRSHFFSNSVKDKVKIIMVYKGRGNNRRQQLFDIFDKGKDKNKYNFFKSLGIIYG